METPDATSNVCSTNAWIAGQVARAFWDLDDANNENGVGTTAGQNDTQNLSSVTIAQVWDSFVDGTGNRQDRENNNNGVNAKDYDGNFDVNDTTFLNHNCIQNQDN